MKHTVAVAAFILTFTAAAHAEEPPFYANYNWQLNPGDRQIPGDELAAMIVGVKQIIKYPSGLSSEQIYKTDGTYEFRQDGNVTASAPSYEIHPSGLACIDAGTPPDKPFCTVYVMNGDRFIAIQHMDDVTFQVEVTLEK